MSNFFVLRDDKDDDLGERGALDHDWYIRDVCELLEKQGEKQAGESGNADETLLGEYQEAVGRVCYLLDEIGDRDRDRCINVPIMLGRVEIGEFSYRLDDDEVEDGGQSLVERIIALLNDVAEERGVDREQLELTRLAAASDEAELTITVEVKYRGHLPGTLYFEFPEEENDIDPAQVELVADFVGMVLLSSLDGYVTPEGDVPPPGLVAPAL